MVSATLPAVLVVDDDRANLDSLAKVFERERYHVLKAENGKDALEVIRRERVDVVITDLMMPGMSGVDLLKTAKTLSPETEVILITAYGTIETAVVAMKGGAYDFITKPFKRVQIVKSVKRALEKQALIFENRQLRAELESIRQQQKREYQIIGTSIAMKRTLEMIHQVAPSSATVLLQGDSGTGKELFARAIHRYSQRAEGSFIAINCAAIPETILESELFGYEKGAFTGAVARKEGRFKLADKGTVFLDEIAETSPQVQVKLLRVLQEGEFERLGGTSTVSVDVRVIAATNKNLFEEVKKGNFREDLYYRLNVITVELPPLRDRKEDVPLLADYFLQQFCEKNNKAIKGFSRELMDLLMEYDWPGNVRELENLVERAVVLAKADVLTPNEIPDHIRHHNGGLRTITITLGTPLDEIEQRVIRETLKMTGGDKRLAAQLLGIATRTIYRKI